MASVKRVSALSQILQEQQTQSPTTKSTDGAAAERPTLPTQTADTVIPQSSTTAIPQSPTPTKKRMTDSRDKMTFYLNPGQRDKLDALKQGYKAKTGQRLKEQDLMRLIIERIDLGTLLPE